MPEKRTPATTPEHLAMLHLLTLLLTIWAAPAAAGRPPASRSKPKPQGSNQSAVEVVMISVTATPLDMANADLEEAADLLPAVYTMHAHLEAEYIIRHEDGQVACAIYFQRGARRYPQQAVHGGKRTVMQSPSRRRLALPTGTYLYDIHRRSEVCTVAQTLAYPCPAGPHAMLSLPMARRSRLHGSHSHGARLPCAWQWQAPNLVLPSCIVSTLTDPSVTPVPIAVHTSGL